VPRSINQRKSPPVNKGLGGQAAGHLGVGQLQGGGAAQVGGVDAGGGQGPGDHAPVGPAELERRARLDQHPAAGAVAPADQAQGPQGGQGGLGVADGDLEPARGRAELGRRALGDQPAGRHQPDPGAEPLGVVQLVAGQQHRAAPGHMGSEQVVDAAAVARVEADRRLVQD